MDNTLDEVVDAGDREAAEKPPRWLEVWLPMVIVAADQGTKALIRTTLPLHDFPFKTVVIAVIATAALIGVGMYAASLAHHQLIARLGLALIIGGAAGNLIDRVVAGSVVDFVDVYWGLHHFWAFNVADSAISIGVAIMILDMLGVDRRGAEL
jgi:lipoprotein signal peptidase